MVQSVCSFVRDESPVCGAVLHDKLAVCGAVVRDKPPVCEAVVRDMPPVCGACWWCDDLKCTFWVAKAERRDKVYTATQHDRTPCTPEAVLLGGWSGGGGGQG